MSSSLYSKTERILIIESDGPLGERIKDALSQDGYWATLVKASDGLTTILDSLPHLIILDVVLEGADSYDILEKKQSEPLLAKIPVILLSTEVVPVDMLRIPPGTNIEIFMSLNLKTELLLKKVNERLGNTSPETENAKDDGRVKILWVEDDKLIGNILSKKMTASGFDLTHVKTGKDALKKLESFVPDVIVLDLILPGMNGMELAENIKRNTSISGIPMMILTNLSEPADMEHAKQLGVQKFLIKAAVSPDEIVRDLRTMGSRY